jgi:divinyl chlorophyllide a 8-vinyl-reductase
MSPTPTFPERACARRVFLLGATGAMGQATARALVARGHEVVALVRPRAGVGGRLTGPELQKLLTRAELRFGEATNPVSLRRDGFCGEKFDAVVSCLASRTGSPRDAWRIDCEAHRDALAAAKEAGVRQFVLLSAICVQKPKLAFQQAKLAFERELIASGMPYSIVRPTAFFKSLSGQVERLKAGKPYLMFGDGTLTACKPISDADLGAYIADCLDNPDRFNRILPIGGPGPAITPRQQGEKLFELMGAKPRYSRAPVWLLDIVIALLATLGRVAPTLADKAEFARIGRYYATESMLVLDPATGRYDADATPATGGETLFDFYARLLRGEANVERGDHAVF